MELVAAGDVVTARTVAQTVGQLGRRSDGGTLGQSRDSITNGQIWLGWELLSLTYPTIATFLAMSIRFDISFLSDLA